MVASVFTQTEDAELSGGKRSERVQGKSPRIAMLPKSVSVTSFTYYSAFSPTIQVVFRARPV